MKISLCKHTPNVDGVARFLDRNLRKVKIDVKGCIGECKSCKKCVVAELDGEVLEAKDAYGLLKEIRKVLRKKDQLNHLKDEELKDAKKQWKEELERPAGKDRKKEASRSEKGQEEVANKGKGKSAQEGSVKKASKASLKKEEKKDALKDPKLEEALPEDEAMDLTFHGVGTDLKASLIGDEIVLTIPSEQFSLDRLKIQVHFGRFGAKNSTYEVVRKITSKEEKNQALEEEKRQEAAQVMTFSAPDPAPTKPLQDHKDEGSEKGQQEVKRSGEVAQKMGQDPKQEAAGAIESTKGKP